MTDVIDFEAAKDRRTERELDAGQAHWESVSDQLAEIMEASGLHQTSLVSAGLRAIIEALDTDTYANISRHDAKALIARSLNAFQEPPT